MAYDFPNSPSNGDTVTANGVTYTYNSTSGAWKTSTSFSTAVSETAPSSPVSGNLWFDPNSLETFVYYNDGDSNQWVQTNPGGSSGGITVYSSIDDLPLSGASTGDQAYVSGNNRLYIWNGTGWYNIALINTTPSISGASSAYTLATDGSSTTVTITATDPEGIPITYSIASDTSGNIATVSQGTGSNTNVFTITPSTNTANAGTFSLTFRASDGVNIATAVSEFTLLFSVANSNYTTALITSVGANNAVNNSFDDASTNNHTITASGNVTQGTFSPYRHGGYSTYFDGTGDYIRYEDASLAEGTDDFTVEFWVKRDGTQNLNDTIVGHDTTPGWQICFNSDGSTIRWMSDATDASRVLPASLNDQEWHHVVYQRDSGTLQGFLDGVSVGTASVGTNFTNNRIEIGVNRGGTAYFTGNVRDVRIINGTAFYSSSGFDVPTEPLTAVSGTGYSTTLLTCHLPYIADDGANSLTPTINGNTKTEPFSPYVHSGYSASNNGGSMYFDGSGDYLTTSAIVLSNSTAFTIEMWYYNTSSGTGEEALICQRNVNSPYNGWRIFNNSGATDQLRFYNGTGWVTIASNLAKNQWHHIAVVSQGSGSGQGQCYLNGVAAGSAFTTSSSINYSTNLHIGTDNGVTSRTIKGYLSDVRVVNGTAIYTGNFDVPTEPLTAVTNTALLLRGTDAGIIDKSQSAKTLTLTGDVQSSSTQTKNSSTSIKFDGTGDKIEIPDFQLLRDGRDFTIEFWIYLTDTSAERNILETFSFGASTGWTIYHLSGGRLDFYPHHTNMTTLSATTWTHIAIENYNGTIKCFVNGTSAYSTTHTTTSTPTAGLRIGTRSGTGGYFDGYMEDIRITDGYARYQGTNFTAPTAALQG
jgi:hypothetical protein